jgi:hypothetical protein
MLDVAAGILVLASVGIFLAHTLDAYRAQLNSAGPKPRRMRDY